MPKPHIAILLAACVPFVSFRRDDDVARRLAALELHAAQVDQQIELLGKMAQLVKDQIVATAEKQAADVKTLAGTTTRAIEVLDQSLTTIAQIERRIDHLHPPKPPEPEPKKK